MPQRKNAWLCIACVALGCNESRTPSDVTPTGHTAETTQVAGAPRPAFAQGGSSEASTAGAAGAAGAGAAAGGGGQPSAGHPAVDCDAFRQAIKDALGAFKRVSPNTCASDADCTLISSAVYRTPALCLDGCGIAVASAYGREYTAFAENDPGVTATCNAALQAGCGLPSHSCPCRSPCGPPSCVAGACK